jgi:hypothetical protein
MKIIFDKYKCPGHKDGAVCRGNSFEVMHKPMELSVRRGWVNPDGYEDFFYGKCLSCGYNLNLSQAIIQEYGAKDYDGRWVGPYPCLALQKGYLEPDPRDSSKTVIHYAYECQRGRRK